MTSFWIHSVGSEEKLGSTERDGRLNPGIALGSTCVYPGGVPSDSFKHSDFPWLSNQIETDTRTGAPFFEVLRETFHVKPKYDATRVGLSQSNEKPVMTTNPSALNSVRLKQSMTK
jgi:hypothetical protein